MELWVFTTVLCLKFGDRKRKSFLLEKSLCRAATYAFKNDLLWCRSAHNAFSLTFPRKFFHVHPTGTLRQNCRKLQSFNITVCTLQRELNLINRALSDVLVQQEVVIYYHLHPQLCDLTGPAPFPLCTAAAVQELPLPTASGNVPILIETRFLFRKTKHYKLGWPDFQN